MELKIALHSDVGIQKTINQDSLFMKAASTDYGPVALLAVCDGMGGLSKGELASATLVRSLDNWFMQDFPALLYQNRGMESLKDSFWRFIDRVNRKLASYGSSHHNELGTTMASLLIIQDQYLVVNVGDSRVYLLSGRARQITKDQTYVQKEIDAGRMTERQAKEDVNRNVLLQCVGASQDIVPDFYIGTIEPGTEFLLCSDGFRHMVSDEELYCMLHMQNGCTEQDMEEKLVYLTELNKQRRETDNISSILVRCD